MGRGEAGSGGVVQVGNAIQHGLGAVFIPRAIQRDVTPSRQCSLGAQRRRAGQSMHRKVIGHQHSVKANPVADDPLDDTRRQRGRMVRVQMRIDDMGRHQPGQRHIGAKRRDVVRQIIGAHHRQGQMRIRQGAAMARRMLAHRLHPGRKQTGGNRPRQSRHHMRICAIAAITHHAMRSGQAQVQHRGADDIKPGLGAVAANQRAGQPRRTQTGRRVGCK